MSAERGDVVAYYRGEKDRRARAEATGDPWCVIWVLRYEQLITRGQMPVLKELGLDGRAGWPQPPIKELARRHGLDWLDFAAPPPTVAARFGGGEIKD